MQLLREYGFLKSMEELKNKKFRLHLQDRLRDKYFCQMLRIE